MKVARPAALSAAAVTLLSVSACTSVEGSGKASSSSTSSASSSETSSPTSSDSSSSSESSSTSSESSSPTSSESSSSSDLGSGGQSGLVRVKIGEEGKTSDMSVKLNKVVDPVPSDSSSIIKPDAGKRWVAVNMTVTNTASKPLNFSPTFCVDAKTDKNQTAQETFMASYGTTFNAGSLQKGDTSVGDITFEVPNGQKIKQVDVKCSLNFGGDERTIRFDTGQ